MEFSEFLNQNESRFQKQRNSNNVSKQQKGNMLSTIQPQNIASTIIQRNIKTQQGTIFEAYTDTAGTSNNYQSNKPQTSNYKKRLKSIDSQKLNSQKNEENVFDSMRTNNQFVTLNQCHNRQSSMPDFQSFQNNSHSNRMFRDSQSRFRFTNRNLRESLNTAPEQQNERKSLYSHQEQRNRSPNNQIYNVDHLAQNNDNIYKVYFNIQKMKQNLIYNRRLYHLTHSEFTHQNKKEQTDVNSVLEQLPDHQIKYFANKQISNNLNTILIHQKQLKNLKVNHRKVIEIQKTCILNQEKVEEKKNDEKIDEENIPTDLEKFKIIEELEHLTKNNQVFKQLELLGQIQKKHEKRMNFMQNGIRQKQIIQRQALKELLRKKDEYLESIFKKEELEQSQQGDITPQRRNELRKPQYNIYQKLEKVQVNQSIHSQNKELKKSELSKSLKNKSSQMKKYSQFSTNLQEESIDFIKIRQQINKSKAKQLRLQQKFLRKQQDSQTVEGSDNFNMNQNIHRSNIQSEPEFIQ